VVLEAAMLAFDATPIGRIHNSFSKDMYTVNEQLVVSNQSYLVTPLNMLSAIFVVMAVTPMFLFGLVLLIIFYVQQQKFFHYVIYRKLKQLNSVSRLPIYVSLGETIDGFLTIRAFEAGKSLSN
jgi:ATP-binding cassette subfamily C (CFTR/MRP) protein 1